MPAIVLNFTTEMENLDIVGAASATKKAGFIRSSSRSHKLLFFLLLFAGMARSYAQ